MPEEMQPKGGPDPESAGPSSEVVISVKGVSKAYRIWENPSARLTSPLQESLAGLLPGPAGEALRRRAARRYRDFYALKDVSFEVRRGESVGIIGRNGSGKSTLLQIIAGTLQPTDGSVKVTGRVAALLELGSGFNPEFTGRENVYLNGAVLGLSRPEIDAKFDSIAAFADIGDFIDQPVKTYSSGMMMRLGFAVQTAMDADLLIVDEALSVGDAPFQAKCFQRIRTLQASGCTILFVSHDLSAVRSLCEFAVFLTKSRVVSAGPAKSVCDDYQLYCMAEQGITMQTPVQVHTTQSDSSPGNAIRVNRPDPAYVKQAGQQRSGTGQIRLIDCYIEDMNGRRISIIEPSQDVRVCWLLQAAVPVNASVVIALTAKTLKGSSIISGTDKENDLLLQMSAGEVMLARMTFRFPLKADHYYLTTSIFAFPKDGKYANDMINFSNSILLDLVEYSCYFEVNWNKRWCHFGPVQHNGTIELHPVLPFKAQTQDV